MSRYIGVVGMSVGVAVCMCASSPWSKYSFNMMIGFIYDDEAARLLVILFILVMIVFIGD